MKRKEVFEYVKEQYGIYPDYPWKDTNAVLRHKENNKWFGLVMEVNQNKLGIPGDSMIDVLNIKSDPILIGTLRTQPGFYPAYHMNKDKWLSINLDGGVSEDDIKNLLDMSYDLTGQKKKHNTNSK